MQVDNPGMVYMHVWEFKELRLLCIWGVVMSDFHFERVDCVGIKAVNSLYMLSIVHRLLPRPKAVHKGWNEHAIWVLPLFSELFGVTTSQNLHIDYEFTSNF